MSASPTDFTPTHVVPSGGLQAWASPDPSQPVVATIEARVEVVVREERGAWAEVVCNNGWSAWVDGRRLVAVGATGPVPSTPAPTSARAAAPQVDANTLKRLATPPVVGAAALAVGTLLPWTRSDFGSGSSFDVPISFLWSTTPSNGVKLGVLLLLLAIAGGVVAVLPDVQRFRVAIGGVAALCTVVFVIQLQRALSGSSLNVTDVLGFGVLVALAGAIALAVAPLSWPTRR